jgi:aminoglycoside phosphotransferase (APT) family kinase protein
MIGRLRSFLIERAPDWRLPLEREWRVLFHNNYHPHHSNINLLWFSDGARFPQVVTKVFPRPEIPAREFANLQRAYRCAPEIVPKPLHFGDTGDEYALWMAGMPGWRPSRLNGARLRALIQMIGSLHQAVRAVEAPGASRWERAVSAPLATLRDFGTAQVVRDGCARLESGLSASWLQRLPIIPQHGDLYADNVLHHGGSWHVIDWESYGTIDLPFYDVVTLLYSVLNRDGRPPRPNALLAEVPSIVDSYGRRMGLTSQDLRLLFPLALANWFHLQWSDGRQEFATRMYAAIQAYFEQPRLWEHALLGSLTSPLADHNN